MRKLIMKFLQPPIEMIIVFADFSIFSQVKVANSFISELVISKLSY